MPECHFHPGVETNVRCPECERYICPKDMVDTPVGYKCRECGLTRRPRLGGVKPRQLLYGALAALGAALVLAPVAYYVRWFYIGVFVFGAIVGEAARRGGGGHRTWEFGALAAAAAFAGAAVWTLILGFNPVLLIGAPIVAWIYVSSLRLFG